MTNYKIVNLTDKDEHIVWEMLVYAAQQRLPLGAAFGTRQTLLLRQRLCLRQASPTPTLEDLQTQDYLARYAQNWGRSGDLGFAAQTDVGSIGAAWLRLWLDDDKGFGYIDDSIPELAIAVLPEYRGQGIGTKLLMKVLKSVQSSYPAISLSVRADNPVVNLYRRAGFAKVDGSEIIVEGIISSFKICVNLFRISTSASDEQDF